MKKTRLISISLLMLLTSIVYAPYEKPKHRDKKKSDTTQANTTQANTINNKEKPNAQELYSKKYKKSKNKY
jgi:uncharacterized membrane protein